jgi:hypothetical protein
MCKDSMSEQDAEHVTVCFSYQSVRLSLSCYGATSTWNPRHMNLVADSSNSRLEFSCAVLQAWSRSQLGENFYGCIKSIIWPVAYNYLCSSVHISTVQRVSAPRVCHHQGLPTLLAHLQHALTFGIVRKTECDKQEVRAYWKWSKSVGSPWWWRTQGPETRRTKDTRLSAQLCVS